VGRNHRSCVTPHHVRAATLRVRRTRRLEAACERQGERGGSLCPENTCGKPARAVSSDASVPACDAPPREREAALTSEPPAGARRVRVRPSAAECRTEWRMLLNNTGWRLRNAPRTCAPAEHAPGCAASLTTAASRTQRRRGASCARAPRLDKRRRGTRCWHLEPAPSATVYLSSSHTVCWRLQAAFRFDAARCVCVCNVLAARCRGSKSSACHTRHQRTCFIRWRVLQQRHQRRRGCCHDGHMTQP
jgi:hypothetical protein